MNKPTECKYCKKEFISNKYYKKYCSKDCLANNIKLKKRNNYLLHKGFYINLAKKQRKLNPNYQKEYNKIHKKRINEQRRLNRKIAKQFIRDRLIHNIRTRIRGSLRGKLKANHTLELVGCTIRELKQYLESQFKQGMSWSNYGKWHIDHIKPCALFDLSKLEQQKICFNYKNLQPLWAEDNLRKGANYDPS